MAFNYPKIRFRKSKYSYPLRIPLKIAFKLAKNKFSFAKDAGTKPPDVWLNPV